MESKKEDISDEEIKLEPPKFTKQEGFQITSQCLSSHFLTLIVGKPGSGKSHLIQQLLLNHKLYYQKFDQCFFLTSADLSELLLDDDNRRQTLDMEWIYQKLEVLNNQQFGLPINVLILIDDLISDVRTSINNPLLMKLLYNRRHILKNGTISLIITTQKYNQFPLRFRSIITNLFLFPVQPKDLKSILEDTVYDTTYGKALPVVISQHWNKQKHNFAYFKIDSNQIFLNFKQLI